MQSPPGPCPAGYGPRHPDTSPCWRHTALPLRESHLNPTSITKKKSASEQLRSVQCLRAVAALFVVGFHGTLLWHDNFLPSVKPWDNGNSGVDLFFVISGFIMMVSSRRLLGLTDGWRRFIVLRLVRIVPMYWLTTSRFRRLQQSPRSRGTPFDRNTIASFLFLPAADGAGFVKPVLAVGWTLSFEMLFYVVFAAALFFALDPLIVVGVAMTGLALVSLVAQPDWPAVTTLASPFVLESSLASSSVAHSWRGGFKRPRPHGRFRWLPPDWSVLPLFRSTGPGSGSRSGVSPLPRRSVAAWLVSAGWGANCPICLSGSARRPIRCTLRTVSCCR